ncbi:MAG: CBS domain-containing protein [Planctomycetota bacterium]
MSTQAKTPTSVKQMMSTDVVSLPAGSTVHDALSLMISNQVSALPVVDRNDCCVGIITTTDLVQVTYDIDDDFMQTTPLSPGESQRFVEKLGDAIGSEPLASFMSESVCTVSQDASIAHAAKLMLQNQVHHLPVVGANEKLTGILSTMDVLGAIVDER